MWGGRGLVYLYFQVTIGHPGKPRQEAKAGTWRHELMKRPWRSSAKDLLLLNLLSYRTRDHQPKGILTHSGIGPPTSISS